MNNKFKKFATEEPKRVPLKEKRANPSELTKAKRKFHTMKATAEAYEKFDILHMATGEKFADLLDQAAQILFEAKSLENEKVAAMAALLHDYKKPDEHQTSIEEFL